MSFTGRSLVKRGDFHPRTDPHSPDSKNFHGPAIEDIPDVNAALDPGQQILLAAIDRSSMLAKEHFAKFNPDCVIASFAMDGATEQLHQFEIPKSHLGGVYVENSTGVTISVFLGTGIIGEPYFSVPSGCFKALPVNTWDKQRIVSVVVPAVSAGRIRVILSAKRLGPVEGTLIASGGSGVGSVQSLINGAAGAGTQYPNASAFAASQMTVFLTVSAATTVTVQVSPDGVQWVNAENVGMGTFAQVNFTGAGSAALAITPAPFVRISSSNAVNVQAQVYAR